MNDKSVISNHNNPINEAEKYQGESISKEEIKVQTIIDRMDEEDRIRELQRRARIEKSHKQRIERIQHYQMRLTFSYIGIGIFALISGYWISGVMHETSKSDDIAIMADGTVSGTLTGEPIVYEDWKLTLVNSWNPQTTTYKVKLATLSNGMEVDSRIEEALLSLIEAGRKEAGLDILVYAAYRSKEAQSILFNEAMEVAIDEGESYWEAYQTVTKSIKLPGTSEHALGLAVDLVGRDYQKLDIKQSTTATAIWLAENCHRFGFILRYPEGKESITGYSYESWHFRYVGELAAESIKTAEITLEEYLRN